MTEKSLKQRQNNDFTGSNSKLYTPLQIHPFKLSFPFTTEDLHGATLNSAQGKL